jgi:hypothetical protein
VRSRFQRGLRSGDRLCEIVVHRSSALLSWLFWWLLTPAAAGAQARHPSTWVAWDDALDGAGCRGRQAIVGAVEALLERSLGAVDRTSAEVVLEIRLDASAPGLGAHLSMRRATGEVLGVRHLTTEDPTCAAVSDGLPLVIAMLVDLHEPEGTLDLPSPPDPRVEAPAGVAPPPWASLEVGTSLDVGGLPEAELAVDVIAELGPRPGPLSAMVRAAVSAPQTSSAVEVWGARGAAGACLRAEISGLALGGCALLEVGWLRIVGRGFDVSRAEDAPRLALTAMLQAVLFALAPFSVRVELGVAVPLIAHRFVFDDDAGRHAVFVASPVGLRGGLAIGIRLP